MVKRNTVEGDAAADRTDDVAPAYDSFRRLYTCGLRMFDNNDLSKSWHCGDDFVHRSRLIVKSSAVPVSVGRDQDYRFDLGEAIRHSSRTKIRRARRPHCSQCARGEERDGSLW